MAFSVCSLFRGNCAVNACGSLGKIKIQKNPAIKDWIAENKKNGRPFLLNSENSLKLKWLQVSKKWLSLRQTAKIPLFSAFLKTEKNFLLNRKDFFSETTIKCYGKRCKLATFVSIGEFLRIGLFYFFYCLPHQFIKLLQFHHFRQCGIRIIQLYKTVKFFRSGKILH